jgi:hypothetical protein
VNEVRGVVSDWTGIAKKYGIPSQEQDVMAAAFENN